MSVRTLIAGVGVIVFGVVLVRLFTVHETLTERTRRAEHGPANVLQLTGAALEQLENGELRARVWAERATYAEDDQETLLETVRFRIFPAENGSPPEPPIEGVSDWAHLRRGTEVLILEGNVHVTRGPELELDGEYLVYEYEAGLLTSPEWVRVRDGETVYEGIDLEYQIAAERLRLSEPRIER